MRTSAIGTQGFFRFHFFRALTRVTLLLISAILVASQAAAQISTPGGLTVAQSQVGSNGNIQVEGELEILYQDFKDGRHSLTYSLKRSDGSRVPLQFAKEPPTHLLTGDHVRANGQLSGGSLVLYSGSTSLTKTTTTTAAGDATGTSTASSIPVPNTFGVQSTLVI